MPLGPMRASRRRANANRVPVEHMPPELFAMSHRLLRPDDPHARLHLLGLFLRAGLEALLSGVYVCGVLCV